MGKSKNIKGLRLESKGELTIGNVINVNKGAYYFNNIEHIEHFHAESGNQKQTQSQVNNTIVESSSNIIDQLLPFFMGNREEAYAFVQRAQGALPTAITSMVNSLIGEKKIRPSFVKKEFWEILHNEGLYNKSLANWNDQIEK